MLISSAQKPEPVTPKSEALDELELQYPPEPMAEEPIASTSAVTLDSAPSASAEASSSSFFTWEPPPKQEQDRKRSRAEYEADSDATDAGMRAVVRARLQSPSPSMGPAFPILTEVDVKALNSPLRWFMEVRRREGG
jgi:hypothetical protein